MSERSVVLRHFAISLVIFRVSAPPDAFGVSTGCLAAHMGRGASLQTMLVVLLLHGGVGQVGAAAAAAVAVPQLLLVPA